MFCIIRFSKVYVCRLNAKRVCMSVYAIAEKFVILHL